jgi:outer membrane protein assembly factor BamB
MAMIYLGVRGNVLGVDRATGEIVWTAKLKGADFVNVLLDEGQVFATTKGEAYCLDAATGREIWHNTLPGQGWGLVTIATPGGATALTPNREKQRRDEEAAQASTA